MGISKPSQGWAKHQKDMAVLIDSPVFCYPATSMLVTAPLQCIFTTQKCPSHGAVNHVVKGRTFSIYQLATGGGHNQPRLSFDGDFKA